MTIFNLYNWLKTKNGIQKENKQGLSSDESLSLCIKRLIQNENKTEKNVSCDEVTDHKK